MTKHFYYCVFTGNGIFHGMQVESPEPLKTAGQIIALSRDLEKALGVAPNTITVLNLVPTADPHPMIVSVRGPHPLPGRES